MSNRYPSARRSRTRRRRRSLPGKIFFALRMFILVLVLAGLLFGGAFLWWASNVIKASPSLDPLTTASLESASYICSQDGTKEQKLTLAENNRDLVSLVNIPHHLQHAFVAIEDKRFYTHSGVDLPGIARAFVLGLKNGGHFSEGASTITQQLLKNSVFTDWMSESTFEDRLKRKVQEQFLALQLEKVMSKDQILENYLNVINLGAGCYGVQAASYRYFGKDVTDLTLSESAVIAGITQNPTAYNPIKYPEANARRRKTVLDNMLDQGYISSSSYQEALADDVYSRIAWHDETTSHETSIYTYYQDALIDQIINDLISQKDMTYKQAYKLLYSGGLRIYSAQDSTLQAICDEEFENPDNFPAGTRVGIDYALSLRHENGEVTDYSNTDLRAFVRQSDPSFDLMYDSAEQARASAAAFKASVQKETDVFLGERISLSPQPQASVVLIDQATGYVRALVGGRGHKDASLTLNRATYTTRQPGSTFKILTTYAPALDACGDTLATLYDNEPTTYTNGIAVSNWDLNNYSGPTTIREAIVRSVNVVAVRCLNKVTPKLGYEYARALGITTLVDSYDNGTEILSDIVEPLALGGITRGVTTLDLCSAYSAIANLGMRMQPKLYTQVLDSYGNVILDNTAPVGTQVLQPSTAYLLTDAMKDVIASPEGTANTTIDLGEMPVSGKSGTTSDYRDIWFAGYTPYYTCCVWGGYDNNDKLPDDQLGHTYSKVLWNRIMNRIHEDLPVTSFTRPADVVEMAICPQSGKAADPGCSRAYIECFRAGTQPTYYCSVHGSGGPVPPALLGNMGQGSGSGQDAVDLGGNEDAIVILSSDQTVLGGSFSTQAGSSVSQQSVQPEDGSIQIFTSDEYIYDPYTQTVPEGTVAEPPAYSETWNDPGYTPNEAPGAGSAPAVIQGADTPPDYGASQGSGDTYQDLTPEQIIIFDSIPAAQ
ncbi:MAG: transglycosylase domain-containing protein [Lachnospiraceae bacterium]|nr:transglycosylase domain-containing protein [Lachnospiraceae bacterium]